MTVSPILRLFIERLSDYYFTKRRGFYTVSTLTFCVILLYANIRVLIFHKSEQSVAIEAPILAAILLIGLPVAYELGLVLSERRTNKVKAKSSYAVLKQYWSQLNFEIGSETVDVSSPVSGNVSDTLPEATEPIHKSPTSLVRLWSPTEDELNLWQRFDKGDETALKELALFYLPLVNVLAKRLARLTGADREDLRQEGVIGLMEAIAKFDSGQGVPFRAFAKHYISASIFVSSTLTRDFSRRQEEVYRKTRQIENELKKALQRDPTVEEVAEKAELTVEQIRNALHARVVSVAEASPLSEDQSVVNGVVSPQQETKTILMEALSYLSERERSILRLFYYEDQSTQEIAERVGLHARKVSKIRHRAINKLRKTMQK